MNTNFLAKIKLFWITAVIVGVMPFIGFYIYDPLQVFHKHISVNKTRLHGNMRLQAAGIINNYDFDSIVIGTSMLKGTSAKYASELFKKNFVNISMNAGSIKERSVILGYALSKKKIKTVIFSFDTGLDLHNKVSGSTKYPLSKFEFLYDRNKFNDLKIYWNERHLSCLFQWSLESDCIGVKRELPRNSRWFDDTHERNKRISAINNWIEKKGGRGKNVYKRLQAQLNFARKPEAEKLRLTSIRKDNWLNFSKNDFLPLVLAYSEVDFNIVLPPYSSFLTSFWMKENPLKYQDYKDVVSFLVEQSEKINNLSIYSFDLESYRDDITNYRDLRHYNLDMNNLMLVRISEDKNRLTEANVKEFFAAFDKKNMNYDLDKDLNQIFSAFDHK